MVLTDGRPQGQGLGLRLWRNAEAVALESLHCPFVTGLAQGTLARRTFQHYVAQDAFYLQFFARAYALAMSKCDPAHISRATFDKLATMLHGVHAELRLHDAYALSWGVDLDNIVPSPATLAYTDFLMEVAQDTRTGLAEVLCAMAPCARLYAFLGCQLANAFPGVNHAYSDWIRTYSSESYLAIPTMKEAMLDEAANAPGTDLARLQRLYTRAMQLEVDFFQAQPAVPPPRTIRSLVVDFDDTCTEHDTISLLFEAAAQAAEKAHGPAAGEETRTTAKQLSSNYLTKYQALMQTLLPVNANGNGLANGNHHEPSPGTYDAKGLAQFLDQLSDFDAAMIRPVEESGVLAGLTSQDVLDAASHVRLQPGCRAVLDRALASGLPTHVLSINWSSHLITQVGAVTDHRALKLDAHSLQAGKPPGLTSNPHSVSQLLNSEGNSTQTTDAPGPGVNLIVANQLEVTDDTTTGRITTTITCARDKARAFSCLSGTGPGASVYVGDSTTDLAPMLQADYGIVVGSSSSLRKLCQRFGVKLQPLITAPLSGTPPKGVLYEASSWSEIQVFLFGPNTYEAQPYKSQMQAVRTAWAAAATAPASQPGVATSSAPSAATTTATGVASPSDSHQGLTESPAQGDIQAPFVPVVLTIAGSDSGGGAGIQADLKAMQACGVFGTSALAALTAQNTHGVHSVHVAPLDMLSAQVDSVLSDLSVQVVKTGMLPTPDAVKLVADKVRQYGVRKLVVDPVMVSTSGHELAGSAVAQAMVQHLLPLALLVTPNIPEASVLLGGREIHNESDMVQAARDLHAKLGCQAVLVKGGHLVGSGLEGSTTTPGTAPNGTVVHEQTWPPHTGGVTSVDGLVTDVLFDGHDMHVMRAPVIPCNNTHGTGCTLASAVSSFLARGQPLVPAVMSGREYLQACLRHSTDLCIGTGVQRPFNHGWQLADWQHQGGRSPSACTHGLSTRWAHADVAKAMTLYAVTDPKLNDKHGRTMEEAVAGAVAGGATIVQIREKDCEGGTFLKRAEQALKVCRAANVPLIINDRVDIALALGPDVGVHIGQGDIPVHIVRTLLGPGRMLGVSCKTPEHARKAIEGGADYLGVGAVYPTTTKDSRVIGTDGLAEVVAAAHPVPIVAIGGIKDHHINGVMATGAAGIAVVTAIFDQVDIPRATHKLYEGIAAAKERAKK